MRFTKLNYCQYLLSSQINYTLTHLADHVETISHDLINRYLRKEKLTPKLFVMGECSTPDCSSC